jgi:hypothetical protein
MRWSQLKKRIEGTFADSVKGRVQVWNTRYRHAHDGEGEAWITIDKKRIQSFGYYSFVVQSYDLQQEILRNCSFDNNGTPASMDNQGDAHREADKILRQQGVFPAWEVNQILFDYLSMGINEILQSGNPLVRGLGMLDKRCGKRRLAAFDDSQEHALVKTFFRFRCQAEEIEINS